jgi:hypothetical protein
MATALLAIAAIALGHAIQIKSGFYAPDALPWLTISLACSAVAVARPRSTREWGVIVDFLLLAGIVWQLSQIAQARPALYLETQRLRPFHVWAAVAAMVALAGAVPRPLLRAAWFPVLVAIVAGMAIWVLRWSPSPKIDVITVTDAALRALIHGHSPYAIAFDNIYGPGSTFYAPGLEANGRVLFGYPYPPVSLLLSLPAYLLGDYRYASLVALLVASVLMVASLPSQRSRLAAALFLTTPRVFFVLEQGWSEPMSLLLVAIVVFCLMRWPRGVAPLAGVAIASKQYLVVALVPLWRYATTRPGSPWRLAASAVGAAAAVTLPFLLWSPKPFVQSVVLLQAREPFRQDSLSYFTWVFRQGWPPPSSLWTMIAMLAALTIVALRRAGTTASSFSAALAFTTLTTFAFGKKAFCNYYFFVIGALCCAIAAAEQPDIMANKRRSTDEPVVRSRP